MSKTPPSPPVRRARFVTLCQQVLALGLIVAALTPAANVVSLDVVPSRPAGVGPVGETAVPTAFAAYARASTQKSVVPTEVVDPTVTEYPLTAPVGARVAAGSLLARTAVRPGGRSTVTSRPQPVTGYGAVGVTWGHGQTVPAGDIAVEVRMQDDAAWSDWMPIEYDDDHGPDPDSEEAARSRPGTDPLLVGEVDEVQVRIASKSTAPGDLKLAVIDPGEATASAVEAPALDTADAPATAPADLPATAPADGALVPVPGAAADREATPGPGADGLALQKAAYTPKPTIYSRAQWGADERMRDPGSLHYFEVHAGFVHHTVNANDYTRAQVPGILRSIYAYHTRSKGWSDIGYNYLVDRFGRIWEGRYGGIDRPVVGAHTLGYNDDAFAMSAIGNFDVKKPPKAMVQAYGALFAWKLSLHGVSATSNRQYVTSRNFRAINGHRDAGSTACPGRYLYAKLPRIRELAGQAQNDFSGRQLESNLASGPLPDLVVRRASDGRGFVLPVQRKRDKSLKLGRPIDTGRSLAQANRIMNAGDWDRDGFSDVMFRHKVNGALYLYRGDGTGALAGPIRIGTGFKTVRLLAAVGDMTGDGWPDLMGKPAGGDMRIYPGLGANGFRSSYVAYSAITASKQIPVGLWDGDGAPDSIFRRNGAMTLYSGNGPGGLTGAKSLPLNTKAFDWVIGVSDVRLTGHPDLLLRTRSTKKLYVMEGSATGFAAPQLLGGGLEGYDMAG